eukprot:144860-Chlamydomonas_euryale.AAC.3
MVSSTVGSSGTSDELGRRVWPLLSKNVRNRSRTSAPLSLAAAGGDVDAASVAAAGGPGLGGQAAPGKQASETAPALHFAGQTRRLHPVPAQVLCQAWRVHVIV